MEIRGSTVLISGGASGLGAATARYLAAAGANIVILDQDAARAEALANELGAQARFAAADVTDEEQVQATVDLARSAFGALHINVNCAGIDVALRTMSKNSAHPLDLFEMVVRVNLIGMFNVVRLAALAMAANPLEDVEAGGDVGGVRERGVIINTTSVAAYEGGSGQAAYAASKGGIASMTAPIARDLEHEGIRVCAIATGVSGGTGEGGLRPGARAATPDDFVRLVAQIIATTTLNGEVLRLDAPRPDLA